MSRQRGSWRRSRGDDRSWLGTSRERIDGIVALLMGLDGASRNLPSVYEKRGPLFITLDQNWVDAGWSPPGEEDD